MRLMKVPRKQSFSLFLSLVIHFLALQCVERYSIAPPKTQPSSPQNILEKKEKSTLLKEFAFASPTTSSGKPALMQKEGEKKLSDLPLMLHTPTSAKPEKVEPIALSPGSFSFEKKIPFPSRFFNKTPELSSSSGSTPPSLPRSTERLPPLASPLVIGKPAPFSPPPISQTPLINPESFSLFSEYAPPLRPFPSLEELEVQQCDDYFDMELTLLPKEEGEEESLFALTLIPRSELSLPSIPQHYTFLIDRSHSIQADRLRASKNAVKKALTTLGAEDTFNIIAFDSRIEKFSSSFLPPTEENLGKAEEFLDRLVLGSLFSPADLYKPLFLTLPFEVSQPELHTAILLTDGETLAKRSTQRALLAQWTAQNQGKVALFGVGIGGDIQLRTLDVATAFNRGKLFHSPAVRGIKRKLLKLMKSIETPIAKNISCYGIAPEGEKIVLFSKVSQSPHLYLDQPYTLLGTVRDLEDFTLFIQGHLKKGWLNIKKKISFSEAKEAHPSLKAEWALKRAYQVYEAHAHHLDASHLKEIEDILAPYDLKIAFK